MSKYYITTPEIANGISALEAQKRGCTGETAFWWDVINHPTNGQSAIVFQDSDLIKPNDTLISGRINPFTGESIQIAQIDPATIPIEPLYENGNTKIFQADLLDHATLESQGWFPILATI